MKSPLSASGTIRDLVAIDKTGKLKFIRSKILRKWRPLDTQNNLTSSHNILLCCTFRLYRKKLEWSPKINNVCHPFRDVSVFPKMKKYLLSESDMIDPICIVDNKNPKKKKWDFIYFTLDSIQGVKCKGFHNIRLMDKIAGKYNLRGLVVDYYHHRRAGSSKESTGYPEQGSFAHQLAKTRKIVRKVKNVCLITKSYNGNELCELMQDSRFIIFPNTRDCSPRMLTEAIVRGVPVLVNKGIWGGWKYVNKTNGMLYDAPFDIFSLQDNPSYYEGELEKAIMYMLDQPFDHQKIRNDYLSKYGLLNTSAKLAKILNKSMGRSDLLYVGYAEVSNLLESNWKSHYRDSVELRDVMI